MPSMSLKQMPLGGIRGSIDSILESKHHPNIITRLRRFDRPRVSTLTPHLQQARKTKQLFPSRRRERITLSRSHLLAMASCPWICSAYTRSCRPTARSTFCVGRNIPTVESSLATSPLSSEVQTSAPAAGLAACRSVLPFDDEDSLDFPSSGDAGARFLRPMNDLNSATTLFMSLQ